MKKHISFIIILLLYASLGGSMYAQTTVNFLNSTIKNINTDQKYVESSTLLLQLSKAIFPTGYVEDYVEDATGENCTVLHWDDSLAFIEWSFTITRAGQYSFGLDYYMDPSETGAAQRSMMIDGKLPSDEANNLNFGRLWQDAGEPQTNSAGDEMRSKIRELTVWQTAWLGDSFGYYSLPFEVYLAEGVHTIRLSYVDKNMLIGGGMVATAKIIPDYSDVKEIYTAEGYKSASEPIFIEAEEFTAIKNSQIMRADFSEDPTCSPFSYDNKLLNIIGGSRWSSGLQSLTWSFISPADGLYKMSARVLQSINSSLPVYRKIAVDGEVPFSEMLAYRFDANKRWTTQVISDDEDNPYLFYLSAGTHTVTMTVQYGELTEILKSFDNDNKLLTDMLLDITKLVGGSVDVNYDYEFFRKIPTLEADMRTLCESLTYKISAIETLSGKSTALSGNLKSLISKIEYMLENPFKIAKKLGDLETAQTNMGSWYISLQKQPLGIDYLQFTLPDGTVADPKSSIWQKLKLSIRNFVVSFYKDYDNVGNIDNIDYQDNITVWVARGTDWAEKIKEMSDAEFTPSYGIRVNMNILPVGQLSAGSVNVLMLAIVAGTAPDVALATDTTSPFEFAVRDVVTDLTGFPDYNQVAAQFLPESMVPFRYMDGIYGLPENMDFKVLFYRTDIVEQLGIPIPKTRTELYETVLPILYQNGMQFYYPRDDASFLYQYGAKFYTDDGRRSALDDTPQAFKAFKEEIELFTNYGIPVVADFYNRFRTGQMPMGIGSFSTLLALSYAAPEIAGRWDIALIPGLLQENGSISITTGNLAFGADVILSKTNKQNQAWKFLKWWTSTETQSEFGNEIEALLGPTARWNSANFEAFYAMPWKTTHLSVIKTMLSNAKEVPNVLGSYFTARHMTNMWNQCVINGTPLRDALEEAVASINREMKMKQEEYGIYEAQQ